MTTALLALSATGCESQDEGTVAPVVDENASLPQQGGSTSIMRPDMAVDQPVETPAPRPLRKTVPFGNVDDDALGQEAEQALSEIVNSEQLKLGGPIILRGHSDSGGGDQPNLRASRNRAERVKDLLIERGVNEDRISVIAFGEQNPIAPNALPDGTENEEGRRANRRVEVEIELPNMRVSDETGAGEMRERNDGAAERRTQ